MDSQLPEIILRFAFVCIIAISLSKNNNNNKKMALDAVLFFMPLFGAALS